MACFSAYSNEKGIYSREINAAINYMMSKVHMNHDKIKPLCGGLTGLVTVKMCLLTTLFECVDSG